MIPTKICGITNFSDAHCAVHHGASAIGFIFYNKSPRFVSVEKAKSISDQLPIDIARIGVFVNCQKNIIDRAIQIVPISMIQLHGDETPEFCNQFEIPVIKALRIIDSESLSKINDFQVAAFLLDTFSDDSYGGTGKTFDWSVLEVDMKVPIILSGGLNPENILDAIESVNPSALDINSGLELAPGIKDHTKIKNLFSNIISVKPNRGKTNVFQFSTII